MTVKVGDILKYSYYFLRPYWDAWHAAGSYEGKNRAWRFYQQYRDIRVTVLALCENKYGKYLSVRYPNGATADSATYLWEKVEKE